MIYIKEDGKQRIDKLLSSDLAKQRDFAALQQDIHSRLAAIAQATEERFRTEREQLLPIAHAKLQDTIKPWWQEFEESGTYQKLFDWVNTNEADSISVSSSIIYPDGVEAWHYGGESIVQAIRRGDKKEAARIEELNTRYASQERLQEAHFKIQGEPFYLTETHGFRLARWPVIGKGFGYAMVAHQYEIPLRLDEADDLPNKIHPEVLIEFAGQIETGRVWEIIDRSMKRSSRAPREVSGAEVRQRDAQRAEEYRRLKPERYTKYLSS